ncbi:MAG: hypothetical protein ACPG7F_03825, partial [Aggregatilineales bacterium]
MRKLILLLLLIITGCESLSTPAAPSAIPFPTMTVGQALQGNLTPIGFQGNANTENLSNPATAIALVEAPTATPDYGRCPADRDVEVTAEPLPQNLDTAGNAILRFLSGGGDLVALEDILLNQWQVFDDGYIDG